MEFAANLMTLAIFAVFIWTAADCVRIEIANRRAAKALAARLASPEYIAARRG